MSHTFYLRLVLILIFLLFLLLLLALPVQIRIVYEGRGRRHKGRLGLGIFNGKLSLNASFPPPPRKGSMPGFILSRKRAGGCHKFRLGKNGESLRLLVQWRRLRKLITGIRRSIGVFKELLRRSVCTRLLWETGFGLDDYAATGMAAGLVWAGKGLLIGLLSRHLRINPAGVRIAVVPRFGGAGYVSTLDCILETYLGYIIIVLLKLCVIWLIQTPGILIRRNCYA